jgi:hypothetical protein
MSWRSVIALLVLGIAGGAAGFAWLSSNGNILSLDASAPAKMQPEEEEITAPITAFPTPPIIEPTASQAEALLLISNARDAIEAGRPLGDLGSKLQLNFGQRQPQALAIIANGVKQPISNAALLDGFDAISSELLLPIGTSWDRVQYETRNLFIIRAGDAKPDKASNRIANIRQLIIAGDIATAAQLVRVMPGAARASGWLKQANGAIAVHQALDLLNQSVAMLAPASMPAAATPQPSTEAPISAADGE